MHICHIITRLIIGGAQENTLLSCRGLVERGHRVTLAAGPETGPEGSLWDAAAECGCELVKLDSLRRAVNPLLDANAFREIKELVQRTRPDVVHTHSSKAGILGRFAAASAGGSIIVHTIHGMSFNRSQPMFSQWLYRGLERLAAFETDAFVTVADAMIDQSVAARIADRRLFRTIRSGMETDQFGPNADQRASLREQWSVRLGDVVVGTVARLFENKGYEEIIEAMPAAVLGCPNLQFVWIGDGAHRIRYERRLETLGLRHRVRFIGLVQPQRIPELLTGMDILVHASRWEGLPRAIVQALLTEVPAVSFDNDGAPEVVIQDRTGIPVRYGQVGELAQAIVTLAGNEDLRRKLGRQGREHCLAQFDWRRMVDELEKLYVQLTKSD